MNELSKREAYVKIGINRNLGSARTGPKRSWKRGVIHEETLGTTEIFKLKRGRDYPIGKGKSNAIILKDENGLISEVHGIILIDKNGQVEYEHRGEEEAQWEEFLSHVTLKDIGELDKAVIKGENIRKGDRIKLTRRLYIDLLANEPKKYNLMLFET